MHSLALKILYSHKAVIGSAIFRFKNCIKVQLISPNMYYSLGYNGTRPSLKESIFLHIHVNIPALSLRIM